MKKLTKLFGLVLILALVLSMGLVSASAATPIKEGTITFTKSQYSYAFDNHHLYRLFDATEAFDEDGNLTAVSYTCTDAQKAVEGFDTYFTADAANNVSAKEAAIVVNEETGEVNLSAGAVRWIKAHIEELGTPLVPVTEYRWSRLSRTEQENTPFYTTSGSYTYIIKNLSFGYYYIDSTVGAAVMINTAKPETQIVDKNGVPTMTKMITDVTNGNGEHPGQISENGKNAHVQIGDTVTYTITVTAMPGAEQYILSDSMNWGLTLDPGSISIIAGPPDKNPIENPDKFTTLVSGADYTLLTDTGTGYTFRSAGQDTLAAIGKWEGDTFTPAYEFPEGFSDYISLANRYHNGYTYEYPEYFWPDQEYLSEHNITDYGAQIVVLFDQDYLDTITEATNIILTYNATPNATLIETYAPPIRNNSARLNYGHSYELRDTASVISWQLVVYKYEGDGESIIPVVDETDPTGDGSGSTGDDISYVEATPLNGVKFMLKRADGLYLKQDPNTLAIRWVDIKEEQPTELVTGKHKIWVHRPTEWGGYAPVLEERDGYIVVNGLAPGTYTLEETAPLPGYNKAQDVTFSLPPQNTYNNWRYQVDIPNKPGTVLPETGGSGTAIYYLLGFTVLLSGAAVLLRRREKAAGAQ